jgi:tetratricopeptide (TPR) repeat protein
LAGGAIVAFAIENEGERLNRRTRRAERSKGIPPAEKPPIEAVLAEGIRAHRAGRLGEAERRYREVLADAPQHPDALNLLGVIASHAGQHGDAARLISEAIRLGGEQGLYLSNLGNALRGLNRLDEAVTAYRQALAKAPQLVDAYYNLGTVLSMQGQFDRAIDCFDKALALRPDLAPAWSERGVALWRTGRGDAAAASYERAIAVNPAHAEAHFNLGVIRHAERRHEEALASYAAALRYGLDRPEVHVARGITLRALGRPDDSAAAYDRALALKPDHPDANLHRGLHALALGDWTAGWAGLEWRFQTRQGSAAARQLAVPMWQGLDDIAGRTLLIWAEKGMADTLQFCRYVGLLQGLGAEIVLEVPAMLIPLLGPFGGSVRFIETGTPMPEGIDLHCPLLSLPHVLRQRLATIPDGVPYLAADPVLATQWAERLGAPTRKRIGLSWPRRRGLDEAALCRAAASSGAEVFVLQRAVQPGETAALEADPSITPLPDAYDSMSETAAVIQAMDLIITGPGEIAHLAGALGRPVWILQDFAPDWRWQFTDEGSVWYPTARQFRQTAPGTWDDVLDRIEAALKD